jgi:DNA-binding transcriptional LysR family regulator
MTPRPSLIELNALIVIATHRSFRKAADELGVSRSTLSHMMRALEERMGVRLLHRTTRSVSPTEAGASLITRLRPILTQLDTALDEVNDGRERPAGLLRINAPESGAVLLVRHVIPAFLAEHPGMAVDLVVDGAFVDIVEQGFDAGVRVGDAIPQDMVAVRFGGDLRFLAVAAPAYLAGKRLPEVPDDLKHHRCVRARLPSGKHYSWEFMRQAHAMEIDVSGPLVLNHSGMMVEAALQGVGIAFVPERYARADILAGRLVPLLEDWSPVFPSMSLYYPGHRHVPSGLRAFIDVLRRELGDDAAKR